MNEVVPEQRRSRELAPDERLLWAGRPRQGVMVRPTDAFIIPFRLLWCGFAIFWESSVVATNAPFFFKLWGIPFVLVGLYFVVGRLDARQRQNTVYGVTSSRVILISGLFHESVRSLQLRGLSEISLSERPDGSGSVVLGPTSALNSFAMSGWPGSRQYAPPSLEGIPQARVVHDLIRRAQGGANLQRGPTHE